MDELTQLITQLLRSLRATLPNPVCSADWLSTLAMLGGLIAALPVATALVIAVAVKVIGVQRDTAKWVGVGVLGVIGAGLLPWLCFAAAGSSANTMQLRGHSCFVGEQTKFFRGSSTVFDALINARSGMATVLYVCFLAVVPFFAVGCSVMLGRAAFGRSPWWAGRLFIMVPTLIFALVTAPMNANVVCCLWLGYLPAIALGARIVGLVGRERPAPVAMAAESACATTKIVADKSTEVNAAPQVPVFPGLPPDDGLARFRKQRALGEGGFGTVWLAMDTHLNRMVAVKLAHAPNADSQRRMLREARALAAVHHPNCVHVYDVLADNDGFCIVMEYLEGSSLAETVRSTGFLDDLRAARLWVTMAGALDEAHRQGVLHRDIKPSNIIVDLKGLPHLIDFGIARGAGDSTMTQAGMIVGTPDFLAPEVAGGAAASATSDAWQLAATVSYALSGQPPRGTRETPLAALMAAAKSAPPRELPWESAHRELFRSALAADPAGRPTLADIQRDLACWLELRGYAEKGPVSTVFRTPAGTPTKRFRPEIG